MTVAIFFERN